MHRDLKPQNILLDENLNLKFVSHQLFKFRLILEMRKKRESLLFQTKRMKKRTKDNLPKKVSEERWKDGALWWEQLTT